jgi:hypothetical protein
MLIERSVPPFKNGKGCKRDKKLQRFRMLQRLIGTLHKLTGFPVGDAFFGLKQFDKNPQPDKPSFTGYSAAQLSCGVVLVAVQVGSVYAYGPCNPRIVAMHSNQNLKIALICLCGVVHVLAI